MQTKSEMINRIAELAQEVKQWKHEYEILDACIELEQGKIAELKAENEILKQALNKEPLAQKALVTAYSGYKKQVLELYKVLDSYKQTLQEIDEIISRTDSHHLPSVSNMVSIIRHKLYELTKAEEE